MANVLRLRTIPADRDNRSYGSTVEFGGGLSRGTGYLAHSNRVGPAVLVVHDRYGLQDWLKRFADALNDDGFTVLVPDLYGDASIEDRAGADADALWSTLDMRRTGRRLCDAATHLTENWHPRLGVVACGDAIDLALELCDRCDPDALVLISGPGTSGELDLDLPAMTIPTDDDAAYDIAVDFLRGYLS